MTSQPDLVSDTFKDAVTQGVTLAYDKGYERGLEDAAKECDKVYFDETSGDYWAGQLADRIRQLKHKQGE